MKKLYLKSLSVAFLFISINSINAQVGVGTTTPNSSTMLDVYSSNKGVSFPNVNLTSETDVATIASPMTGLMVYNTNTSMPCGAGLYFNNGTSTAPIWNCFTKTTKQYHAYNTSARAAITSSTLTLQPGCSISIVIPTGQIADIKIDGVLGGLNTSTTAGKYSVIDAFVYFDGTFLPKGGWNRTSLVNPSFTNTNSFNVCTFSTAVYNVTAGTHTIELYTSRYAGTTSVDIGGNCVTDTNCGEINAIVTYK